MELKDLKKNELFMLPNSSTIWVKGYYCRDIKKYCCWKYNDINSFRFIKGNKSIDLERFGIEND